MPDSLVDFEDLGARSLRGGLTVAPVEVPGGRDGRSRIVAVVAVAVFIVVAALGGSRVAETFPAGSASPSTVGSALASLSVPIPTPLTGGAGSPATSLGAEPPPECLTIATAGSAPVVRLEAPGSRSEPQAIRRAADGLVSSAVAYAGWMDAQESSAVRVSAHGGLTWTLETPACMRHWQVDIRRADDVRGAGEPLRSGEAWSVGMERFAGSFMAPADGDWLIRLGLELAVPGAEDPWAAYFFRLRVGPRPFGATETPPAPFPGCARFGDAPAPPEVALVAGGPDAPGPVQGLALLTRWGTGPAVTVDSSQLAAVELPLGSPTRIVIGDETCSLRWEVVRIAADNRTPATTVARGSGTGSSSDGPLALGEIPVTFGPGRDWLLRATFTFVGGTVEVAWFVRVPGAPVPGVVLVGGGRSVATLTDTCSTFIPHEGEAGYMDCAPTYPLLPVEGALRVAPSEVVDTHLEVAGWSAGQWSVEAASAEEAESAISLNGYPPTGLSMSGGAATIDTVPVILPRGDWYVRIGLYLVRSNGDAVSASYYVRVIVADE